MLCSTAAGVMFTSAWAQSACAQGEQDLNDDVIIVTASKREQSITDVAASISNVDQQALERSGAVDITDIATRIAGLNFTRRGPSQNQLALRGLTNTVGADTEFPVIGFYVDETPLPDTNVPDVAFLDLARIEVLRGPQGTVYGESSMGGTVKLITNQPDSTAFSARFGSEVSTTKDGSVSYNANGVVNIPIVEDRAALRIVASYEDDGGFIDNLATGEEDADAFDRFSVRGTLQVTPTDRLTLTGSLTYQELDQGLDSFVFPDDNGLTPSLLNEFSDVTVFRQAETFAEEELTLGSFVAEYEFDGFSLTAATSIYDRDFNRQGDQPNAAIQFELSPASQGLSLALTGEPFVVRQGIPTTRIAEQEVFSQELRLASNNNSRLQWVVGAYYRDRETVAATETLAPDFTPLVTVFNPTYNGEVQAVTEEVGYEQFSLFGEAQYALTDRLTVIGGLRWFDESLDGQQTSSAADFTAIDPGTGLPTSGFGAAPVIVSDPVSGSDSKVLARGGLSYKVLDNGLIYGTVAQGFRPGGINTRSNPNVSADESPREFGSDQVLTYELGGKSTFAAGRGFLNAAVFYTDASDLQFRDNSDPIFNIVRNAGAAEIFGAELEVVYDITDELTIGGNLTVQSSEFAEDAIEFSPGVFLIEDGQRVPVARDLALGAFIDYTRSIKPGVDLVFYGDVAHTGDAVSGTTRPDFDPLTGFITLESYTIGNLRAGIETDRYSVFGFVENVGNEFAQQGGDATFGINRNKPRTIGVAAVLSF